MKSEEFNPNQPGWVSIPERGIIILQNAFFGVPNGPAVVSGTKVRLPEKGFKKYTGVISELQEFVEGRPEDPESFPGLRAAGTRVVVRPPLVENADFQFSLVFLESLEPLVCLLERTSCNGCGIYQLYQPYQQIAFFQ